MRSTAWRYHRQAVGGGDEVHVLIVTDGCTAQYRNDPRLPQILAQKQEEARGQCLLG